MNLSVVILAAGKGTRMKDLSKPKVLFEVNGKPMLAYIIEASSQLNPEHIVPVVGYMRDQVEEFCFSNYDYVHEFAIQEEQLGTGHAVMMTEDALEDFKGAVLILAGDVPLLTVETLKRFREEHKKNRSDCSVLSTKAPNPFGYGRIVRDAEGNFIKITEEKDADNETKKIDEINSGIFLVDSKELFSSLSKINTNNAQKEYYLTDIISILREEGKSVNAYCVAEFEELQGVNSKDDLARVEEMLNVRK